MSTLKRASRNSVWLLASNIVVKLIGTYTAVAVARYLGDVGLGQYSFAVAFVSFFAIFANFGFDALLTRDIAKNKDETQRYVGNISSIKILLSLITMLILFIVSFLIDKPMVIRILLWVFGLDIIINALKGTISSALQGHEIIKYTAISQIFEKAIWALVLIFIIRMDLGITSIAFGTMITTIIGSIYLFLIYKKRLGKIVLLSDKKFWKKLFIQAWPFTLTGIFLLIYWKIDLVMLSFYQTDAVVGWYSAAYRLLELLMIAPVVLMTPLYPVFSRLAKFDKAKLKDTFKLAVRYLLILMIPIVFGVMLLGDKIILYIYGKQFVNSVIALKILIFATLFAFINYPFLMLLNSMGEQKRGTFQTGISAVLNILLNLILIPMFSYIGASITTVIAEASFLTLSYIYIVKNGFRINFLSVIFKPLIAAIIMGIFIYFFSGLNLILLVICAAIIYVISILALREIDKHNFEMLRNIMRK